MINQQLVLDLFEIKNGDLVWKNHKYKSLNGKIVGTKTTNGYIRTEINGKKYLNHWIIYLMHHGYIPEFIDHINGNRSDNRIENLRKANVIENQQNSKIKNTNKSGVKGVSWHKPLKKWYVQLRINGSVRNFGYYHDLLCAKFVSETMRYKYHNQFARTK
jgi:hypothetical protein